MTPLVFQQEQRQSLFLNRYQYALSLGSSIASLLSYSSLDQALAHLEHHLIYIPRGGFNRLPPPVSAMPPEQKQQRRDHLTVMHTAIHRPGAVFSTRNEYHNLSIFSTDVAYLESVAAAVTAEPLNALDPHYRLQAREAVVSLPSGVVLLKDPGPWRFRTRFSERRLSQEQIAAVGDFLRVRPDTFRVSPGLQRNLGSKYARWLSGTVDHVYEEDIFLLNLVVPNIIRSTMPIQAK